MIAAAVTIPVSIPVNRSVSPSNSSEEQVSPLIHPWACKLHPGSCGAEDLTKENERLRKENTKLSHELGHKKKMCSNIMELMSKYVACQSQSDDADLVGEAMEAPILDMMLGGPGMVVDEKDEESIKMDEVNSPRIFRFSLGLKRSREDESDGSGLSTGNDVKLEPIDQPDRRDSMEGDDQRAWSINRP
jgi:heat shock transcription factor, other eukaryote